LASANTNIFTVTPSALSSTQSQHVAADVNVLIKRSKGYLCRHSHTELFRWTPEASSLFAR
jgi:hypothetical protein